MPEIDNTGWTFAHRRGPNDTVYYKGGDVTLTEFLLARIAEDEAVAKAATAGPWHWEHTDWNDVNDGACVEGQDWDHHGPDLISPQTTVITSTGYDHDRVLVEKADGEHIARHDPARVLVECEAKQRIVENYRSLEPHTLADDAATEIVWHAQGLHEAINDLAQVYADHPDFRDEWRA